MFDNSKTAVVEVPRMSAAAVDTAKRGIVCGITRSLAMYLFNHTADLADAKKKIRTYINALVSNGDLDQSQADWQTDVYFRQLQSSAYAVDPNCSAPCCSEQYMSWFTVIYSMVNDPTVGEFAFGDEDMKKLLPNEQKLVTTLQETRTAYYKASHDFEQYFCDVAKQALAEVLLKYGTTLTSIAPEWYESAKRSAGVSK